MTRLLPTLGLICALTGPAIACDSADPAMTEALETVLTTAEDPAITALAGYLNDRFYGDLACRLEGQITADAVLALRAAPARLIALALAQPTPRNQSDALMLMLSAMQEGAKT